MRNERTGARGRARANRRRLRRRRRPHDRRLALAGGAIVLAAAAIGIGLLARGSDKRSVTTPTSSVAAPARRARPSSPSGPVRLTARRTGSLDEPLQDAAVAALPGGRVLLAGGLTASDTSTDAVRVANASGEKTIGRLPTAIHDAGAARLGRYVYVFGGGDGTSQHDEILRIDPTTGQATLAGHLPAPSSDQTVTAAHGAAYVVGGFTGARWLDTIVRWSPGGPARVVAHLPAPVRYAAVTSTAGHLVVAGGSLPSGTASAAVYEVTLPAGRVRRLASLPAATTHAAAATIGDQAIVVGGRGSLVGTPTRRIVGIDPRTGSVRPAGTLRVALSDEAVAAAGGRLLVLGGRDVRGTVDAIDALVPAASARRTPPVGRTQTAAKTVDVYARDGVGMLAPAARSALPRIYVPNSRSDTVDVIDPRTYRVVESFSVGALPQHVVPAWNLKTLYVTNDLGNSLTPIDPYTGRPGKPIPVDDPYNMYFTPDGRYAIVVAERLHRLDFRNARTFTLHRSVDVPCAGVDHMDFSADGSYAIASCEFSGQLLKLDVGHERVVGTLQLPDGVGGMPQDVKLSPDGRIFYVADMHAGGLWKVDGDRLKVIGFVHTGDGPHGLYVSRDSRLLYVTNRSEGSISLLSFRTGKVVAKWWIPGGGSPDMGNVSADGKVLWLSGRYNGVVYAISTKTGRLLAKIPVGAGPHGLCVWPQPGRYSLGHTGILR